MLTKATRSRYFTQLSSKISTMELCSYKGISCFTPAGYDLNQGKSFMVVTKLKLEFPKQTIVGQQINRERMKGIIKTGNGDGHDCGNADQGVFEKVWG